MINASEAFAAAVGGETRRFRARLLADGAEVGGELRRMTVHLGSCGAAAFAPGAVFSSYAEITADGGGYTFEGRELTLQLGVLRADGSYEYLTLGRFTAGRPSASVYETTFLAQGRIAARFAGGFTPPAARTLENVLAALTAQTGVEIVLRGVAAEGAFQAGLDGLTCRQALAAVAGVLGGYATERSDGAVVVARYDTAASVSADGGRSTVLPTFGDADAVITGVRVTAPAAGETETAVFASGTPNLERTDGFMTRALFPAYAGNLLGLTYRPGTARLALGDPRLEPWDTLAVTDMAGRTFLLPCMSVVHTFDGGLSTTVTAPGLTAETAIAGSVGQAVTAAARSAAEAASDARRAWSAALGKNTVYYQPTSPAGGSYAENDVWFDTGDGDKMYRWDGAAWTAQTFGTGALEAGAVTTEKLAAGAVTAAQLAAGSITADKLAADVLTSRNLDLFGRMGVFTDDTLSVTGGYIGYMSGQNQDGNATSGIALKSPDEDHYLIVTTDGVRLTEEDASEVRQAYLANGYFRLRNAGLVVDATKQTIIKSPGVFLNAAGWGSGGTTYSGMTHVNDFRVHGGTANVRLLGARTTIPSGADLDDDAYKTIGNYAQHDGSYAVQNAPRSTGAFLLDVENANGYGKAAGDAWAYLRQRLQYLDSPSVWTRSLWSDGSGSWTVGPWTSDRMELLWSNSSPGSAYGADTARFSTGYTFYTILFRESTGTNMQLSVSCFCARGAATEGYGQFTYLYGGAWYSAYRSFVLDPAAGTCVFRRANYYGSYTGDYLIPLYIFGMRR